MQIAALGLGTESVQALDLQVTPAVVQPQNPPAPSVVKIHVAKVLKLKEVQAVYTTQLVPLKLQELK